MVKDESDIIKDWIIYHGSMFGFNNLFIIDNYSTDGTYEIINEFQSLHVNIFRLPDYQKKGIYMKGLIDSHCKESNDIAFPIDIDEFIVLFENNNISIEKNKILDYMNNLPNEIMYKANYITSLITKKGGYDRITEIERGAYEDYKNNAKSFFKPSIYSGQIDHGNHIYVNSYYLTNICLVHYHFRNMEQIKKKILNNIIGLGYTNNLTDLEKLSSNCMGFHHVKSQIKVLKNEYELPFYQNTDNCILLKPLQERIKGGYF
jgi:hypothetical protein